jgi:hypothetical protein
MSMETPSGFGDNYKLGNLCLAVTIIEDLNMEEVIKHIQASPLGLLEGSSKL